MKSIWIIVFLLLIIGSCYKDVFDKDGFYGNCKAKVNGIQWNGNCLVIKAVPACSPDSCISLSFWNFDKNDNLISKIGIQQVQLKKGKFLLNNFEPWFKNTDYHFLYSEYEIANERFKNAYQIYGPDSSNFLEITDLDLSTGNINGKFQARVVRNEGPGVDEIEIEKECSMVKLNGIEI
ncbi:MAG: hypothetical protein U0T81_08480 [Saprospiraceae bacterium]